MAMGGLGPGEHDGKYEHMSSSRPVGECCLAPVSQVEGHLMKGFQLARLLLESIKI